MQHTGNEWVSSDCSSQKLSKQALCLLSVIASQLANVCSAIEILGKVNAVTTAQVFCGWNTQWKKTTIEMMSDTYCGLPLMTLHTTDSNIIYGQLCIDVTCMQPKKHQILPFTEEPREMKRICRFCSPPPLPSVIVEARVSIMSDRPLIFKCIIKKQQRDPSPSWLD